MLYYHPSTTAATHNDNNTMTIPAVFFRLFALPTFAARDGDNKRGGFNFLPALCAVFFASFIGGAAFADDGVTPLHRAAGQGYIASVKHFIDGGADVNTKDDHGRTPLHYAAEFGQTETALALIKAGAGINAKDNDGNMPLHIVTGQGQRRYSVFALISAAADSSDANTKDNKYLSPVWLRHNDEWGDLLFASQPDKPKTALALINAGAYIGVKNNDGLTPLHGVAELGQTEIAHALINAGADIEAKTNDGDTALHIATRHSQTQIVFALINAGARLDAKTNKGWTPLYIVARNGQTEIALALINAGADIGIRMSNSWTANAWTATRIAIHKHGKDSEIARLLQENESVRQKVERWVFGNKILAMVVAVIIIFVFNGLIGVWDEKGR